PANGASDVATARFEPDGSLVASGSAAFNGDGVAFYSFSRLRHSNVSAAGSRLADDVAVDAVMHRDRLLLLLDRDRHPNGPKVPVIAAINDDRIGEDDFESVGLERPQLSIR